MEQEVAILIACYKTNSIYFTVVKYCNLTYFNIFKIRTSKVKMNNILRKKSHFYFCFFSLNQNSSVFSIISRNHSLLPNVLKQIVLPPTIEAWCQLKTLTLFSSIKDRSTKMTSQLKGFIFFESKNLISESFSFV